MTVEGPLSREEQIERVKTMLARAAIELDRGNGCLAWAIVKEVDCVLHGVVTDERGLPWGPDLGTEWHFNQLAKL